MGAGHFNSACSGEGNDASPSPSSSTVPDCSDGGASLRLMVLLHEGFRRELAELRRLAEEASGGGVVVVELRRRVELFKSLYKYHCLAEAQVIFLALETRVKNVTCTYYLQHNSTESMFETIFSCLDSVVDSHENPSQELQELIFHIGILRDSVCQHMVKEEKQVFPLLMNHFSADEQASLVWHFLCSFPVMILEDLFLWLASLLSPREQLDLKDCIRTILTQDKSILQEVLILWIDKTAQQCQGGYSKFEKSSDCSNEKSNLRETFSLSLLMSSSGGNEDSQINVKNVLIEGLLLLHAAIRSDFKEVLDKLYQKRLKTSTSLSSVIAQINFITEVLIIHSDTLEKVVYPLLEGASLHEPSLLYKNEVGGLKKFLNDAKQIKFADATFLEMLCSKVESLLLVTCKQLSFQETEVFPLISMNCNHETQQELVTKSLRGLPLGLLKCVVIWFSSRLPKDNLKSLLYGIEISSFLDKPFASLLHEWIHTGFSGKTSTDNWQEILRWRVSYVSELIGDNKDTFDESKTASLYSVDSSTSSIFHSESLSSGINSVQSSLRASVHSFQGSPNENVSINFREPRPMDHIYYFHNAIKKDLESLVFDAAKLSKDFGFLTEFCQHFNLVRSLYELHSETEDKIAFPALEANPNARNLTKSYSIDHEMEAECFERVSNILNEMSELHQTVLLADVDRVDPSLVNYHQLCLQLQNSCKSLKKILEDHILREETELWPLFREYFSIEEQEQILGYMLGRTGAESLQEMMVWLMAYLTLEEQQAIMSFWLKATKGTKFNEWLGEWWEGLNKDYIGDTETSVVSLSSLMGSVDSVSKSLSSSVSQDWRRNLSEDSKLLGKDTKASTMVKKMEVLDVDNQKHKSSLNTRVSIEKEKHQKDDVIDLEQSQQKKVAEEEDKQTKHLVTSQIELEASIRRLQQEGFYKSDLQAKIGVPQNSSHLLALQPQPDQDNEIARESGKLQGQYPSYRDMERTVFGCKHYKQNCKLLATCCNRIFTCRRCHDEEIIDHVMERKSTTHMMCMKCLEVQPLGQTCSTISCNKYSMAKYYCWICRLFDDEREIYHCPYCNLCRVGKGLGIDYFHCMKCNACLGRLKSVHTCIERCIEDKCPICQEDMFTSTIPVKSLNCGHVMHSTCFQDYTCLRYTCPICSKSLGNMQVYFEMLDALLAEEKMPEEYRGQTQAILCNDCEKKGAAPFHWQYHKCPYCGSYNTRLL